MHGFGKVEVYAPEWMGYGDDIPGMFFHPSNDS